MRSRKPKNVLCFGEVLWDELPDGRHAGGAPLNVAYHLTQLGVRAWPVSAVGADEPGNALLSKLDLLGVRRELIAVLRDRPTGTVDVTLVDGLPSYDIRTDVAWDQIGVPARLPELVQPVDAVIFGSLAQRLEANRQSLHSLLQQSRSALHVFDVNLRPPFDDRERVWQLASDADLIKLNDEEMAFLLQRSVRGGETEAAARQLAERIGCARVCVTCGASGAGLLDSGTWYWVDSQPVDVRDTIGAGDSFLAALVQGYLTQPEQSQVNLRFASRLAGFVAGSDGATPAYSVDRRHDPPGDGRVTP